LIAASLIFCKYNQYQFIILLFKDLLIKKNIKVSLDIKIKSY